MEYNINLTINNVKQPAKMLMQNDIITFQVDQEIKTINNKQIIAINQIDSNNLDMIISSEQIIRIESNNALDIYLSFINFTPYNGTSIKINNKVKFISKKVKLSIIYTICFIIIYNGLIGMSYADEWEVSYFAAFIGGVLGGNDSLDIIEIVVYILLFIEIIVAFVTTSSSKKRYINVLQQQKLINNNNNNSNQNDDNYKDLEKLKELLDKKIITEEDFNKKKEDILKRI